MSVKIRLQRKGRKKRPFYHIVVADSHSPRDGRFIEKIGSYNPLTRPATIEIDHEKAFEWVMKGAQPTDTVRAILRFKGVYYRKHLTRAVLKGAISEDEAAKKYADWMEVKEIKTAARVAKRQEEIAEFHARVSGSKPEKAQVETESTKILTGDIEEYISEEDEGNIEVLLKADVDTFYLKLTIDRDFDSFSEDDEIRILEYIQEKIQSKNKITVQKIEPGSVIITIKLSRIDGEKLMQLLYSGKLNEVDITNIEMISFEDMSHTIKSNLNDDSKNRIESLRIKLKEILIEKKLDIALKEIKNNIKPSSTFYNEMVINLSKFNNNHRAITLGTKDDKTSQIEMSNIIQSTLTMIDELSEVDLI